MPPQADFIVSNGTGNAVRSDINGQLAAIVSNSSGSTEPATMYAYQWWADTTTGLLKQRNSANSAWITIGTLASTNLGLATLASPTFTGVVTVPLGTAALPSLAVLSDPNTGVFSPGADQVAISTGGTSRLAVSTTAVSSTLAVDIPLGAVGTPSLTFTGDLNTGAFSPGADTLALVTAGTSRLHITSGGLVGIGSSAPGQLLEIKGANARFAVNSTTVADGGILLQGNGTTYAEIKLDASSGILDIAEKQAAGNITFSTGTTPTERVRVDSSGRLLVGTSTARANFFNSSLSASLQIEGISGTDRRMAVISSTSDSNGAHIILAKQKSGALGGNTIVANADQIGSLFFLGSDGSEFVEAASILCEVDGTPGANDLPGRLVFSTTADGASTSTERMRIANDGTVYVGTTSKTGDGLALEDTSNGGRLYIGRNNADSVAEFQYSGTRVGQISVTSSSTSYVTSSDYRLKENVVPLTGASDRVNQLQVHRFNFIADPDNTVDGFIAHEAQEIVPECVTGEKDAVDDEGKPVYQGIDQSKLVPLLTAALQEALQKIEDLEGRLIAAGL